MIIHERCTQTTRTYGYTHAPLLDPPPAVSIASTVPAATIQPCTSYSQNNHDVDICGIYFTTPSEKSNSRTFPFTSILGRLDLFLVTNDDAAAAAAAAAAGPGVYLWFLSSAIQLAVSFLLPCVTAGRRGQQRVGPGRGRRPCTRDCVVAFRSLVITLISTLGTDVQNAAIDRSSWPYRTQGRQVRADFCRVTQPKYISNANLFQQDANDNPATICSSYKQASSVTKCRYCL
jgi:hypothetical protein